MLILTLPAILDQTLLTLSSFIHKETFNTSPTLHQTSTQLALLDFALLTNS